MKKCHYCNSSCSDKLYESCDIRGSGKLYKCRKCYSAEPLAWEICKKCKLICSHCGETNINNFNDSIFVECIGCFDIISCKKCIVNNYTLCKDFQNL